MLMRCCIAALVIWGATAFAQSQQPAPSLRESVEPPQSQATKATEHTPTDQRGTEKSPIVIKVLPPDNEQQKAEAESKREAEKTANDGRLALFTERLFYATVALSVIAIFQFFSFLWQGIQLKRSVDLARAEYISSHYPRIILRHAYLVGETVHYMLVNLGSTPAKIIESWIFAEFVEAGTRLQPLFPTDHYDLGRDSGFAGGESKELQYELPVGVSFAIKWPETRRIGIDGQPPIFGQRYFVGVLTYTDDLGVKRRSIFRRRWDDGSLTFVRMTAEQERDHEYAD